MGKQKQKRLMCSPITNRIYFAEVQACGNGDYNVVGEKVDMTADAQRVVFEHYMAELEENPDKIEVQVGYGDTPYSLRLTRKAQWVNRKGNEGICSVCHNADEIDEKATHCRYCGAEFCDT